MRTAFARTLEELAAHDERIWLATGDLGYNLFDQFAKRFPDRFINVGVAEQNLVGVAAGAALAGKQVWIYSIVNFLAMRALEQIRNDVCFHNLDVKIVTVGGGLVYGPHGYSHHGVEDLGVMRLMPNLQLAAPGDPKEAEWATRQAASHTGPVYLRLARGGEPNLHQAIGDHWQVGDPLKLREGADATLVATAGGVRLAISAADQLAKRGRTCAVFSVPFLRPINTESIFASARTTGKLISVEDHGQGGLGTILAEQLAIKPETCRFQVMRFSDTPVAIAGSNDALLARHGLSPETIAAAAS